MSTNMIDEMSEREAKDLLDKICSELGIGDKARSQSVILTNIQNAVKRSECLSKIEDHHTITSLDDENEEYQEQLLHWGESPDRYIDTYKVVIGRNLDHEAKSR